MSISYTVTISINYTTVFPCVVLYIIQNKQHSLSVVRKGGTLCSLWCGTRFVCA